MRLIISAFRKDVNPWRQAQDTAQLLRDVQREGLLGQLVIGTYNGEREISVEVCGFVNERYFGEYAQSMLRKYGQTTVFAEMSGRAYLISATGTEYIGEVKRGIKPIVHVEDGTEYLDGRIMYVLSAEAALKQAA